MRWSIRPLWLAAQAGLAMAVLACAGGGGGGGGNNAVTSPGGGTTGGSVVSSLKVTLAATTRAPGQTTTASATGLDQNGGVITAGPVAWSSSNPGVATVTS